MSCFPRERRSSHVSVLHVKMRKVNDKCILMRATVAVFCDLADLALSASSLGSAVALRTQRDVLRINRQALFYAYE